MHQLARTGEHALYFWSGAELRELEEERLVEMAKEWREAVTEQYAPPAPPTSSTYH